MELTPRRKTQIEVLEALIEKGYTKLTQKGGGAVFSGDVLIEVTSSTLAEDMGYYHSLLASGWTCGGPSRVNLTMDGLIIDVKPEVFYNLKELLAEAKRNADVFEHFFERNCGRLSD